MIIVGITRQQARELYRLVAPKGDRLTHNAWRWRDLADALDAAHRRPARVVALAPGKAEAAAAAIRRLCESAPDRCLPGDEGVALADLLNALGDAGAREGADAAP